MLGLRWAQCRRVRPVLWDYASERLSEGPMELVEQHLKMCAACSRELASLQSAQGFLSACRAVEEPAPRSDWNALRRRMVTEGVTPLPAAEPCAPLMPAANGNWNPRAAWRMQLVTSMAGGFAAVLLVTGGYALLHRGQAAPPAAPAVNNIVLNAPVPAAPNTHAVPETSYSETAYSKEAQIIASVAHVLNNARTRPDTAETPPAPIAKAATPSAFIASASARAVSRKRGQAAARELAAAGPSARQADTKPHTAPAVPRLVRNTSIRSNENSVLRFHPYKPKPQDRLPENTQIAEAASRYALEHVRPVSNDEGDYSTYVVGSVLPVSHDEGHDY